MSKITLKLLVIAFLADLPKSKTEQFNKAFELYRQTPNKNLGIERRLNMAGFTEDGLQNLLYDLQQMHGITDIDVKSYKKPKAKEEIEEEVTEVVSETEGSETIDDSGKEKKTSDEEQVKSIREEYPFLNEKDCPEELLIVVGKKIAAWKRYQDLHEQIQNFDPEKQSEEDLNALTAASVKEYEDNQALDAELKHYAEHKEVLAKHESLIEFRVKKEVEQMNNDELMKFVNSSKTFFTRSKKDLEKAKDDADKTAEINAKVSEREMKLKLVKNKLGIN